MKSREAAVPDAQSFSAAALAQKSPVPLYHRLYVILRERITDGVHPIGSVLPSEAEITEAFSVSRIAAKRVSFLRKQEPIRRDVKETKSARCLLTTTAAINNNHRGYGSLLSQGRH